MPIQVQYGLSLNLTSNVLREAQPWSLPKTKQPWYSTAVGLEIPNITCWMGTRSWKDRHIENFLSASGVAPIAQRLCKTYIFETRVTFSYP